MEELLERIESEINSVKEEQAKLEELTEKSAKLQEEEKQLGEELNTIKDAKSGFYQDAKQKLDEKHQEFTEANNNRMSKEKEVDKLIDEKKTEIRKQIAAQKQYLDENRNVDLADLKAIDVDKLRAEKEKLDREIELNSITREEFDKKSDSEKKEIRKAKENYLNNKHRLAEINPKLQLIDALDGKTPKEKFIELDNLDRNIESNFNKNSLDNIVHDINKTKEEKEDIEKLLEQMIAGREKREEERYYEDVKSGLEETENRRNREQKEETFNEDGKGENSQGAGNPPPQQGTGQAPQQEGQGAGKQPSQQGTKQEPSEEYPPVSIEIGREGIIRYDGKEYEVSARDIKYGLSLNSVEDKELKDYLKKEIKIKDGRLGQVTDWIKEGVFDMTLIHAVYASDMPKDEKSEILNRYAYKILDAKNNVKDKTKLHVVYDMKELSKTSFFGRLFRQEVNTDEKIEIYNNAIKAERYGIGKIRGEYETSKLEKFFNKITRREETAKFPIYKAEDVYEVASEYNKMGYDKDGNKLTKKEVNKTFKERLKADSGLEEDDKNKLSDEQKMELKDLVKAHKNPKQPKPKEKEEKGEEEKDGEEIGR